MPDVKEVLVLRIRKHRRRERRERTEVHLLSACVGQTVFGNAPPWPSVEESGACYCWIQQHSGHTQKTLSAPLMRLLQKCHVC